MKKKYLSLLFSFVANVVFSQGKFEGEVNYVKTTYSDTSYYTYIIKGDYVRINESNKYKTLVRSYIVNLQDKSILVINPKTQIYTTIDSKKNNNSSKEIRVINTGNYKYINEYRCEQWRVKNEEENTEITYWIAGGNFNFYTPISQIAMPLDDFYLFYNALPTANLKGSMPMLIEDKTLLRATKSTLLVISIKSHPVNDSVFSVANYQKLVNLQ